MIRLRDIAEIARHVDSKIRGNANGRSGPSQNPGLTLPYPMCEVEATNILTDGGRAPHTYVGDDTRDVVTRCARGSRVLANERGKRRSRNGDRLAHQVWGRTVALELITLAFVTGRRPDL